MAERKEDFRGNIRAGEERLQPLHCAALLGRPAENDKGRYTTVPPSIDAFPSSASYTITMVQHLFEMEAAPAQPTVTVKDFFESGLINETPSNVIESSMFASLAGKAAAGQKEPPNQGTFSDISVVSTLLPYCDAMFIDNKCRALLLDIPNEHKLPYPCSVFSRNTGADFLKYLRDIRDSVTPEHLKVVEDVYGPDRMKPSRGISGVGEFRKRAQPE
jgi:hypothetical protein